MKRPSPRVVTHLVVGALAVLALSRDWGLGVRPLPSRFEVRDSALSADGAESRTSNLDARVEREALDTVHAGETLGELLERRGVPGAPVIRELEAATGISARRVRAGLPVLVRSGPDSTPREIVFQLAVDRLLHVRRTSDSTWESTEERLPWKTDTIVVGGRIDENLYQALDDGASKLLSKSARSELAWTLADIYDYRVDMSRELQDGDSLRVLVERSVGPGGAMRIGNVLAARFVLSGTPVEAIRYASAGGRAEYFDASGRSMRAAFLRAPVEFRRISSVFGMRKHPILGIWRAHKGTDYAASAGTPVRAIGDGVVIFAGHKGGYGNVLEVRHRNGYVSRYGHLRAFAKGMRPGRAVSIGETVAYVGMTGLATAPHLHFEILVGGVQRDPRVALAQTGGFPLPAGERSRFESLKTRLLASLDARSEQLALR